ncbi:hypothetical protein B0H14DRAFT_2654346 [Mycena olivaceomarginata]|nr:hypothetical protein B0H14DRAFT_2654346 [Mycena olivaceomarginata]
MTCQILGILYIQRIGGNEHHTITDLREGQMLGIVDELQQLIMSCYLVKYKWEMNKFITEYNNVFVFGGLGPGFNRPADECLIGCRGTQVFPSEEYKEIDTLTPGTTRACIMLKLPQICSTCATTPFLALIKPGSTKGLPQCRSCGNPSAHIYEPGCPPSSTNCISKTSASMATQSSAVLMTGARALAGKLFGITLDMTLSELFQKLKYVDDNSEMHTVRPDLGGRYSKGDEAVWALCLAQAAQPQACIRFQHKLQEEMLLLLSVVLFEATLACIWVYSPTSLWLYYLLMIMQIVWKVKVEGVEDPMIVLETETDWYICVCVVQSWTNLSKVILGSQSLEASGLHPTPHSPYFLRPHQIYTKMITSELPLVLSKTPESLDDPVLGEELSFTTTSSDIPDDFELNSNNFQSNLDADGDNMDVEELENEGNSIDGDLETGMGDDKDRQEDGSTHKTTEGSMELSYEVEEILESKFGVSAGRGIKQMRIHGGSFGKAKEIFDTYNSWNQIVVQGKHIRSPEGLVDVEPEADLAVTNPKLASHKRKQQ